MLISDLVAQVRARGERCVIYDKMGSYTRAFLDPSRDVLMNPLDARAPRWSPFLEARDPRDFDMMAAALIPQQKDTVDPFWVTAARQLFSNGAGVLRQRGETRNAVLVDHLLKTDLTALAEAMEGTVAQSIVDPENPKTALSVLRHADRQPLGAGAPARRGAGPSRSASGSPREGGEGFLFLTSRGDQHASIRGLISTWLEIAVNALLSLEQDEGRRIWVILDELPTLHQVPSLQPGLAESRQFGGCFVLGVQVASALRDLYGRNGAETISGLCGTRVVLAAPDRDTAQWSADSLGRSEVEEVAEGFSYGANTIRDGVSLTPRRELRALALPSEIMRLRNLSGYLKFPGPFPVASIRLRYVKRPRRRRAVRAARGRYRTLSRALRGAALQVRTAVTRSRSAAPKGSGEARDAKGTCRTRHVTEFRRDTSRRQLQARSWRCPRLESAALQEIGWRFRRRLRRGTRDQKGDGANGRHGRTESRAQGAACRKRDTAGRDGRGVAGRRSRPDTAVGIARHRPSATRTGADMLASIGADLLGGARARATTSATATTTEGRSRVIATPAPGPAGARRTLGLDPARSIRTTFRADAGGSGSRRLGHAARAGGAGTARSCTVPDGT